jgi:choline dehydrogenase-like flavoprotein
VSPETWLTSDGKPFQPQVHYFVGGATKVFGAALYRLRKEDFGELRHYDGVSPAWPISYEEMEPYYTEAEQLYQVHGEHGVDPTDPPASAPYPWPAVSHEPRIAKLAHDLAAAGYHPFHAPAAVMMNEADMPHSRCIRCQTCDGFPCLVHAKSDAEVIAVRPAMEKSNVTLLRNARALRLETNASGREVTGVVAEVEGALQRFEADVVVVSCCARRTITIRTASPTVRVRSDATTCSITARRCWLYRSLRTTRCSRRHWR